MGFFSDLFGGGSKKTTNTVEYAPPRQLPDYKEAEEARGQWWQTLQDWAGQPGYGAIQPNWNDIWENARERLRRQYWGGPEGPGAAATVRANLARRGVSEQPAAESAIARLGMHEANALSDIAIKQAIAEATQGEQGRRAWLGSVQSLAGLKPQFQMNTGATTTKESEGEGGFMDFLGGFGGNAIGSFGDSETTSMLQSILEGMGGVGGAYGTSPDSILGPYGAIEENPNEEDSSGFQTEDPMDWINSIIGISRIFMGDPVGGGMQTYGAFK